MSHGQGNAGPVPAMSCHSGEGLPPAPSPLPRPVGGGLVSPPPPPGAPGALGPICTSVLANAGELAQRLPLLIPHPHSKYLGIKRKAEWTF